MNQSLIYKIKNLRKIENKNLSKIQYPKDRWQRRWFHGGQYLLIYFIYLFIYRQWFKELQFYRFGLVYMGVRLYCNVASTMLTFYLGSVL